MSLTANFVADFSSFIDATKEAERAMTDFEKSVADMGPAADRSLEERKKQAAEVGKAVREVGHAAFEAGQVFIEAYAEEQEAVGRLNSALTATGQATPAVIQAYEEMAGEFQKTTKYADDAIINVEAILTTIGHVGPEQMKLALEATTGLASALKIDLQSAADMVAKSIAKGNEPVGKLKSLLSDVTEKGWTTEEMLKAINKKVDGAAQKELETYNGQMEHLNNVLGDVNEQAGKLLVDTLTSLLNIFQSLPEGVQKVAIIVGVLGTALAPVLISLASLVTVLSATGIGAAIGTALTFIGSLVAAFVALVGWPALIVAAVVALTLAIVYNWEKIVSLTKSLYEGVKTWLVERFMGLLGMIKGVTDSVVGVFRSMYQAVVGGSIVPDMVAGIGDEFAQLDALMVDPVRDATRAAQRAFTGLSASAPTLSAGLNVGALAGGGAAGGTVINISMTGMLGANDPQTRQAITQVVGDALAQSMRGQRLLSSA